MLACKDVQGGSLRGSFGARVMLLYWLGKWAGVSPSLLESGHASYYSFCFFPLGISPKRHHPGGFSFLSVSISSPCLAFSPYDDRTPD